MAEEPHKSLFGRPPEDESPPTDAPPTWAPTLTPEAPQIEAQPKPESAAPAAARAASSTPIAGIVFIRTSSSGSSLHRQ